MNIDKQDERLLHEILSKYKQGIISGLYPGNNITFTPTGCRDKIISSTSSGTEGGIQSIQEGDNVTVDNTDPLNPIISATDNASALLPNGIKQVTESRDLQADDAGHYIVLDSDDENPVILTMPVTNPFQIGDNFEITSSDASNGYDVNGEVTYITNGNRILFTNTNDGSDNPQILEVANYNLGGFIPLSGTEVGSPVTGDIEVFNGFDLKTPNASANEFHSLYMDDGGIQLKYNNSSVANSFIAEDDGFSITSDNASFRGFKGDADYSAAYQVNDYTQLVYVGYRGTATLVSGTITVNTTSIKTGYKIYLSVNTPSGTQGFLSAPTGSIVNETEFVINSTSATDDSTVNWWIAP